MNNKNMFCTEQMHKASGIYNRKEGSLLGLNWLYSRCNDTYLLSLTKYIA